MAANSSFRDRQEQRRLEDEAEARKPGKANAKANLNIHASESDSGITEEKVLEVCERAEKMLEQVNSAYSMFIAGVESIHPVHRRKQLEQLVDMLQRLHKPLASHRFRSQNIITTFKTYCDRWDRMAKGLETGRIKRTVRPGANRG